MLLLYNSLVKVKGIILVLAAAVALVAHGGEKIIHSGDTLVFMGDSITQFGKDTVDGYLRLVVQGLAANGIDVTWHGVGVSGHTAAQMKARFQRDVIDKKPNVVTIFAGVNDCGFGWPEKTDSTPDDVAAMADQTLAAGITPVLLSPTTVHREAYREDVHAYAQAVREIARTRKIPYAATYEAIRAYVDNPVNPTINHFGHKATKDGTHTGVVGNRILAREVLKAFGFDSAEMAKAEAAWNANEAFIDFHPCVKVTEAEYTAVQAAAARAGRSLGAYHEDLFFQGIERLKKAPAQIRASDGATLTLSVSPLVTLPTYDVLLDCGRALPDKNGLVNIAEYALLAAVHALPPATAADLPTEPIQTVDTRVFAKSVTFTCSGYTGTSTLTNFPVAVRLTADSPAGFRYSDMVDSSSGNELRFSDDAGQSFPYEVESWDPHGTSLIWVKVPALAKGTTFTMYYGGRPTDTIQPRWTWAADYVGVWHMAEESGTVSDSSPNGIDAKPVGVAAARQHAAEGVFGKARVNSSKNHPYQGQAMLKISDSTLLDVGDDFTLSAWVKMTDLAAGEGLARIASRNRGGSYAPDWELSLSDYSTLNANAGSNTPVSGTIPSAETNWVHIVGVFQGTNLTTYANGVKVFAASIASVQDTNNKLIFGAKDRAMVRGHFTGLFDEFRLRDAACSADWVKAEYDQSKTNFLTADELTWRR